MYKVAAVLGFALILHGCDGIKLDWNKSQQTPVTSIEPSSCPMPTAHEGNIEWEVHFSPKGGTEEWIVHNIGQANESVYLQGYSFTSIPIANALVAKKHQGKVVEVVLDKSDVTGHGSAMKVLMNGKVPVYIDDKHAIAHNKVIVIDRKITFTGSFNFTHAAENSNAENSIKLVSPDIAKTYRENYEAHKAHSYHQEQ